MRVLCGLCQKKGKSFRAFPFFDVLIEKRFFPFSVAGALTIWRRICQKSILSRFFGSWKRFSFF